MKRVVEPELLDRLPPAGRLALQSRRDLRRINGLMRNPAIIARALAENWPGLPPRQITELGAGDGRFLRSVAKRLASRWPNVQATLLDRQKCVSAATLADFSMLGWRAEAMVTDVFDWPQPQGAHGIVIANLFLHHFQEMRLATLLGAVAERTELFIALEPRRGSWPLFCACWLLDLGCNAVTCHDAKISVRAGFAGQELSALWPDRQAWQLVERPAGGFGHLFIARKLPHG